MKTGTTKISVSQKTWQKYDMPERPRAPMETAGFSGWTVLSMW